MPLTDLYYYIILSVRISSVRLYILILKLSLFIPIPLQAPYSQFKPSYPPTLTSLPIQLYRGLFCRLWTLQGHICITPLPNYSPTKLFHLPY
jgi:hypothetical protein